MIDLRFCIMIKKDILGENVPLTGASIKNTNQLARIASAQSEQSLHCPP